jgi:group I intron endonuclease
MLQYSVYQLRNKVNGLRYIGCTGKRVSTRWKEHLCRAASGSKVPIFAAIREHGAEAFEVSVLDRLNTKKAAMHAESLWIAHLKTNPGSGGDGYNRNSGGEHPSQFAPSTRALNSATQKGRKCPPRGPMPQEWRDKIRATLAGHAVSEETRKKIGDASRGHITSDETRAKRREIMLARMSTPEAKERVRQAMSERHAKWGGLKRPEVL